MILWKTTWKFLATAKFGFAIRKVLMTEKSHPYAIELAQKLSSRPNHNTSMKLRTILKNFGYRRRTLAIIDRVQNYLQASGLSSEFSLHFPESLDDRVTVTLEKFPEKSMLPCEKEVKVTEKNVISKVVDATVQVFTRSEAGSGFIVHPNGLVVTARHVIDNEDRLSRRKVKVLVCPNGKDEQVVDAIVFRSHRQLDFALLWLLDEGSFPTIPLGNPQSLQHAQTVYAVGSPAGITNTVTRGIVSNPNVMLGQIECIQTDAAVDRGNSGGPLITENGEVVGINVWGLGNFDALKFAVPVDYIKKEIDQAIAHGKETCINAGYCPACGFLDLEPPTWYCRNCGVQFAQSDPDVIFDEKFEIVSAPDLGKIGMGRKTLANIQATLDACDALTKEVFTLLAGNWRLAGGTVRCNKVGRISLKIKTVAHTFNLAVLAVSPGDEYPRIEITMGCATGDYAYLAHIAGQVSHFEKLVSSFQDFSQKGTIHYIPVKGNFLPSHAVILMSAMLNLKKKDASMNKTG